MAKLTDRISKWSKQPMRPGEGLHVDIFRAAIMLLEDGLDEDVVFKFLRRAADSVTDRTVPDREIQGAIHSAKERMNGGLIETPQWPPFNPALRAEIVATAGVTLEQLAAASEKQSQDPWFYLTRLYRPNEHVCIAAASHSFSTAERDAWQPFLSSYKYEYVNPSPMVGPFGLTKENKASAHCLDNTGPRVYQVVEFDFGQINEHAALHWHLAKSARLLMLVYSGGKSMHGWYNVRGQTDAEVEKFFRSAVELGADPKMWSRCQFSRLPAGQNNKTGKQQTVIIFEPRHL